MTPAKFPGSLILNVARDPSLRNTRSLLLQSAGYAVQSASSVQEAVHCFRAGDFDLIVLCHSIREEERQSLLALIRSDGSSAPVIYVASDSTPWPDNLSSLTIGCSPASLLGAVDSVLQQLRSARES